MKALRTLIILSMIFIVVVSLAIYGLRTGKLNTPINYALQYYFQLKKMLVSKSRIIQKHHLQEHRLY